MKLSSFALFVSNALVCALALVLAPVVHSQVVFDISVNTSALIGHPAGPFYLDFQLNDGAGVGNGDNTATISAFDFGGGAPLAPLSMFGGVSGSLASTVTIRDTLPFNEFFQAFTPGTSLHFQLSLSNHFSGLIPDVFSFAILDSNLFNLPTLAPGSDALMTIDITGINPLVHTWAGSGLFGPAAGGPPIPLLAPSVIAVPEPSMYGLVSAAFLAGAILWRRRRSGASSSLANLAS